MTPAAPFIPLPAAFLTRMQEMLGADYDNFIKSYENPRTFGLRVNTAKISCEEFERLAPFPVKRIPWVKNGYFYEEEARPSRCPLYQAGLYYLQEPSAMTPAARLPIVPGDYVPVSYTHLDVYKRQPCYLSKCYRVTLWTHTIPKNCHLTSCRQKLHGNCFRFTIRCHRVTSARTKQYHRPYTSFIYFLCIIQEVSCE